MSRAQRGQLTLTPGGMGSDGEARWLEDPSWFTHMAGNWILGANSSPHRPRNGADWRPHILASDVLHSSSGLQR